MYPFERFTERAKKTLTLAQQEAERAGHHWIGTEHLLLGLLRGEGSLAHQVLTSFDVGLSDVRVKIEQLVAGQDKVEDITKIVPTARVKKVIELSFEEARRMGHKSVGTEHLLLGLMIEGEGIGAHVLGDLGVTVDRVRTTITRLVAGGSTEEWVFPRRSRQLQAVAPGGLPLGPDAGDLLVFASALAVAEGATAVGLEHLQRALKDPAVQSLLQLAARIRQATAAREEAVARQDDEAAAARRQDEERLKDEFGKAEAAWRTSIRKPPPE